MKKNVLNVPKGIRFLGQWPDFDSLLPQDTHFILNKAHTGVGATQHFLTNKQKVILCSPRIALIDNKRRKHPDAWVYRDIADCVVSDADAKNSSKSKKKTTYQDILAYNREVVQYIHRCYVSGKAPKLMVTYDSLGHIIDALQSMGASETDSWTVVIDEFQQIFGDSSYKSLTEMRLLDNTAKFKRVIYLSATPFLELYMNRIPEFENLTYIELVWPPEMEEKAVVTNITLKKGKSRNEKCREIIRSMESGKTVKIGPKEIDTTEAVFYINSVTDILHILQKLGLDQSKVNILCSKDNEDRIRKAGYTIGTIPAEGEPHKPYTFCTRSYFLGCDFYSECAYSYVFADPTNITLALDISTDLSQILGRQRLDSNPYKNEAILFFREGSIGLTDEEFKEYIKGKEKRTNLMIGAFGKMSLEEKKANIGAYRSHIEKKHYSEDYLCITDEKNLVVGFNMLYMLAEIRAWEIRKTNYTSHYTVIRQQQNAGISGTTSTQSQDPDVLAFKAIFDVTHHTDKKIRLYSEFCRDHPDLIEDIDFVSPKYPNYWDALGYEGMAKVGFQESKIKAVLSAPTPFDDTFVIELRALLREKAYEAKEMRQILGKAYKKAGIQKKPKASDSGRFVTITTKKDKMKGRLFVVSSVYQKNISFFPFAWLPNSPKDMTIDCFLQIIEGGTYTLTRREGKKKLSEVITEIRAMTDIDKIAKMKKAWLPVACINGKFKTRHDHGLETYSSFVALDYDHFKDIAEMEKAKEYLKKFPFVYAIFETPSGKGIKALILHDSANPENHYNLFRQLQNTCTLPQMDTSVSDLSRGQFFSYDPGIWRNPSPVAYHFEYDPKITPPQARKDSEIIGDSGNILKLDPWTSGFLHQLWEAILTDDAVIKRLDKYWHDKRPEYYNTGNRHQGILVMAGTLCKAGIQDVKAMAYLKGSYPDMPENEIESAVSYSYENNPYGCDRKRYKL